MKKLLDATDKRPAKDFETIPKKDAFGKFECGYLQGNHRKVTKCRLFGASKRRVVTFGSCILLLISLLLSALVLAAFSGFRVYRASSVILPSAPERAVKLFRVRTTENTGSMSYPGRLQAQRHAKLFFRVSGPVLQNDLKLGMSVKKGDVLMRIDPRDYEREVEKLTHNIAVLKSKHRYLEQEHERMLRLVKSNSVSRASYESAVSARDASESEIKSLESSLRIANDKRNDTNLLAPFDARITDLNIEKYEMAQAFKEVVSLQSLDPLEITVNVPEGNIPDIGSLGTGGWKGKKYTVTFPGRVHRHFAVLEEFRPVTSEENGTYELRFVMSQPKGFTAFPGMTAEVHGLPDGKPKTSKVPDIPFSAIFKQDKQDFVWRYDPKTKKVTRNPVSILRIQGEDRAEVSGLSSGTLIVAAGGTWIHEENRISILNPEVLHESD